MRAHTSSSCEVDTGCSGSGGGSRGDCGAVFDYREGGERYRAGRDEESFRFGRIDCCCGEAVGVAWGEGKNDCDQGPTLSTFSTCLTNDKILMIHSFS